MKSERRKFQRRPAERRYRMLFVIATEGKNTEPQYFELFNDHKSVIQIKCLKPSHSSPTHVLQRMNKYLLQEKLRPSDEAWLVVDKDKWTDDQLAALHAWAATKKNYDFALSNPLFEYWLLLHFENGKNITSARDCSRRLEKYLPGYDKEIPASQFTSERIDQAVQRAKELDRPPCVDWPRKPGSTVYRLIERIRENSSHE